MPRLKRRQRRVIHQRPILPPHMSLEDALLNATLCTACQIVPLSLRARDLCNECVEKWFNISENRY